MLPEALKEPLRDHLRRAADIHRKNLADGWEGVPLPGALERKYPAASREWA